MGIQKVIIVYGGELANDVAQQIEAKKPASASVSLRNASERPKTLLDHGDDTVICFVMQPIEISHPTEDVSELTHTVPVPYIVQYHTLA